MQAQTVQERSGTPWIALLLAFVFAAAVVIGVQVVFSGRDTVVTNTPGAPTQVDRLGDIQKSGMSEAGIFGVGFIGDSPASSPHRGHQPMTADQVARAKELLTGSTNPGLALTIARIEASKNGR